MNDVNPIFVKRFRRRDQRVKVNKSHVQMLQIMVMNHVLNMNMMRIKWILKGMSFLKYCSDDGEDDGVFENLCC